MICSLGKRECGIEVVGNYPIEDERKSIPTMGAVWGLWLWTLSAWAVVGKMGN